MKISEIITDKYKLRMPPTVYYELLADVVEAEEEQNLCDDAISRQAVINSFKNWLNDNKDPRSFEEVVKEMPSAISSQKEGDS